MPATVARSSNRRAPARPLCGPAARPRRGARRWNRSAADLRRARSASFEAGRSKYALALRTDTDAFRIANGEADGLPGVAVDVYGDDPVVHLADTPLDEGAILDAALRLGPTAVYVKRRPKDASHMLKATSKLARLAGGASVVVAPFVVEELGVPYEVDLSGDVDGIFLDQRENRRRVREMAKGARVLNLFVPFGRVLGRRSARRRARNVLDRCLRERMCVGATKSRARRCRRGTPHGDRRRCLRSARRAAARRATFDLVILDPPSFSTTKNSRFTADGVTSRSRQALCVSSPGGALLACTNHQAGS